MSFKIYNGYTLPVMPLIDLFDFCQRFKADVCPVMERLFWRKVVVDAVGYIDQAAMGREPRHPEKRKEESAPFWVSLMNVHDKLRRIGVTRLRDPEYDFECRIALHPRDDRILATLYTEQPDMREVWEKQPGVQDYHYQNQTDRPEEITEEEWGERYRVWSDVLDPRYDNLSTTTFGFDPIGGNYPLDFRFDERHLQHVPSFDARVHGIALQLALEHYAAAHPEETESRHTTDWMRMIREVRDDKGGYYSTATEEVRTALKERLEASDFTRTLPFSGEEPQ